MDFKNCSSCGKLFRNLGRNICPACLRKDEEEFQKVKRYLAKHSGAGIQEVVDATEVSYDDIIRFLKEARLELKGGEMLLSCESCGEAIETGRFCNKCKNSLQNDLSTATTRDEKEVIEKRKDVKFRIIDRYK